MFGKVADLLDRRFLAGLLLPVAGFCATLALLVLTGFGWQTPIRRWASIAVPGRWAIVVVAVAVVLFVAVLVGTQVNWLVGIWAGYWPGRLGEPGKRMQRWRFGRLGADDRNQALKQQRYPLDESQLLPTRLGNVLLAAENYSRARYGIDSVCMWPRLYLSVPAEVRVIVDDARRSVDQLIVIATSAVFSALAAVALAGAGVLDESVHAPAAVWGSVVAAAVLIAIVAYGAAVSAAVTFGDLIRSVFDLYRGELLAKLGVTAPKTRLLEEQTWKAMCQFLLRGGTSDADELIEYAAPNESPRSLTVSYQGRAPAQRTPR